MPDALSKTIPIWCAVFNRALFPSETAYHSVELPPNYLGPSEESQIAKRIDGFVHTFKVCLQEPAYKNYQCGLTKPRVLNLIWMILENS